MKLPIPSSVQSLMLATILITTVVMPVTSSLPVQTETTEPVIPEVPEGLDDDLPDPSMVVDNDGEDCPAAHYSSIQDAVDAAEDGDTLLVCAGTYHESVLIHDKIGLHLIADGAILDGEGVLDVGILIFEAPRTVIEGFEIRSYGTVGVYDGGGAIPPEEPVTGNIWDEPLLETWTSYHGLGAQILGNTIAHVPFGIAVVNSAGPVVSGNIIHQADVGIYLFYVYDARVTWNDIPLNFGIVTDQQFRADEPNWPQEGPYEAYRWAANFPRDLCDQVATWTSESAASLLCPIRHQVADLPAEVASYPTDNLYAHNDVGGIWMYGERGAQVIGNKISGEPITPLPTGIAIVRSASVIVKENKVEEDSGFMVSWTSSNLFMRNNDFDDGFRMCCRDVSHYVHDIDDSNYVKGQNIVYLLDEEDVVVDASWDPATIIVARSDNITIQDLALQNTYDGVHMIAVTNSLIQNVTIKDSRYSGIFLREDSEDNRIVNNRIEGTGFSGIILLDGADRNLIDGNTVTDADHAGIFAWWSASENVVTNNVVERANMGVEFDSVYAVDLQELHDNHVEDSRTAYRARGQPGLAIHNNTATNVEIGASVQSIGTAIKNNTFVLDGTSSSSGVRATTHDAVVQDNEISNYGGSGVFVGGGKVSGNTLDGRDTTGFGVWVYNALAALVDGNNITNSEVGVATTIATDVMVRTNQITNNTYGVAALPHSNFEEDLASFTIKENALVGNLYGIYNAHARVDGTLNAVDNYWGAADGPASPGNITFDDPKTGTPADGAGDAVSGHETTGLANVQFDPWLTTSPVSSFDASASQAHDLGDSDTVDAPLRLTDYKFANLDEDEKWHNPEGVRHGDEHPQPQEAFARKDSDSDGIGRFDALADVADSNLRDLIQDGVHGNVNVILTGPQHQSAGAQQFETRAEWVDWFDAQADPFFSEVEGLIADLGGRVVNAWSAAPAIQVTAPVAVLDAVVAQTNAQHAAHDYEGTVELIEPNGSDPLGTANTGGREMIHAEDLWEFGYRGDGVHISVIDTGIDGDHEAFKHADGSSRILAFADCVDGDCVDVDPFDDHGHGTHTAATAAGSSDYDDPEHGAFQETGVAPNADLAGAKFLSSGGTGTLGGALSSLTWSFEDAEADITSNSWSASCGGSVSIINTVDSYVEAGMISVFAAGNSGSGSETIRGPACAESALSIGAVDQDETIAWFSSRGECQDPTLQNAQSRTCPDLVAKGVDVRSAIPRSGATNGDSSGYRTWSGTSMATPLVSGALALAEEMKRDFTGTGWHTSSQAEWELLKSTAKPLGEEYPNNDYGWGLPQLLEVHDLLDNAPETADVNADFNIGEENLRIGDTTTAGFSVRNYGLAEATGTFEATFTHPNGEVEKLKESTPTLGFFDGEGVTETYSVGWEFEAGVYTFEGSFLYEWTDPDGDVIEDVIEQKTSFTVIRPVIDADIDGFGTSALPGVPQPVAIDLKNTGNEAGENVVLKVTVHKDYEFVPGTWVDPTNANSLYSDPPPTTVYDDPLFDRRTLVYEVDKMGVDESLEVNMNLAATSPGLYRLQSVVTYEDAMGNSALDSASAVQRVGP